MTAPPADGSLPPPGDSSPQAGELTGKVLVYEDENFTSATDFAGTGEVGGEGPNGRVTAAFSGASYRLDAVTLDPAFFDLTATETQEDLLFAVELVDASDGNADLHFVRRTVMELIGQNLTIATSLEDGRGHAILFFRDTSGNGRADIQVDGAGAIVAYDTGSGLFRDDPDTATSARGTVAILNAAAIAFPGSVVSLSYTGASSGTVDVKLAGNAVTLVTVVP